MPCGGKKKPKGGKKYAMVAIGLAGLGLAGCFAPKAPKMCMDFQYESKCSAKDHCAWVDGSCKDKPAE